MPAKSESEYSSSGSDATMPERTDEERVEGVMNSHPLMHLLASKRGGRESPAMRAFILQLLKDGKIVPYTLSELLGDYVHFLMIRHLKGETFNNNTNANNNSSQINLMNGGGEWLENGSTRSGRRSPQISNRMNSLPASSRHNNQSNNRMMNSLPSSRMNNSLPGSRMNSLPGSRVNSVPPSPTPKRQYRWNIRDSLDSLSKAAFLHCVKKFPLSEGLLVKLLQAVGDQEMDKTSTLSSNYSMGSTISTVNGRDLEFQAFGLIERNPAKPKMFIFKEEAVEEFLVARYHAFDCLRLLQQGKSKTCEDPVTTHMKDSMQKLPDTGDIWRITFGLLNAEKQLKSVQQEVLNQLVGHAKRATNNKTKAMSSTSITALCVEAIYESQNAAKLTKLLDEFTMNQSINYSGQCLTPSHLPYSLSAVGYLVRASTNVYGLHLADFGLNSDLVNLLTDPVNAVSDNNLQVMNLSHNPIGGRGMQRLQRFLVKASLLTHVDLTDCHLGDWGAAMLSEFFMCLPLRYLRIADNRIGDKGISHMTPNMKYLPTLEWLDLSGNLLTDDAVIHFSAQMQFLISLRNLDLQRNLIGDRGAEILSRHLSSTQNMTHLLLADNRIGGQGAASLAGHCWKTQSLRHVNLSMNNIPQDGVMSLRRAAFNHGSLDLQVQGQSRVCLTDSTLTLDGEEAEFGEDGFIDIHPVDDMNNSMNLFTGIPNISGSTPNTPQPIRRTTSQQAFPRMGSLRRSWHGVGSSVKGGLSRSMNNLRSSFRGSRNKV